MTDTVVQKRAILWRDKEKKRNKIDFWDIFLCMSVNRRIQYLQEIKFVGQCTAPPETFLITIV